jgi:hypothetical protein
VIVGTVRQVVMEMQVVMEDAGRGGCLLRCVGHQMSTGLGVCENAALGAEE